MEEEWKTWFAAKAQWLEWVEKGRTELLGDKLEEGEFTVEEAETEVPMGPPQEEVIRV